MKKTYTILDMPENYLVITYHDNVEFDRYDVPNDCDENKEIQEDILAEEGYEYICLSNKEQAEITMNYLKAKMEYWQKKYIQSCINYSRWFDTIFKKYVIIYIQS